MRAVPALLLCGSLGLADAGLRRTPFHPSRLRTLAEHRVAAPISRSPAYLSGNGEFCAAPTQGGIEVFRTRTGERVSVLPIDTSEHHSGAFTFDGRRYATLDNFGTVRIWDIRERKVIQSFDTGRGYSCAANFTRDGRLLIADDGTRTGLILWDVEKGKEDRRIDAAGSSYTYVSPNGRYVTVSTTDHLTLIDLSRDAVVAQLLPKMIERSAFSPDSRQVIACYGSKLVRWETATGKPVDSADLGTRVIWCEYHPDGQWISVALGKAGGAILNARDLSVVARVDAPSEQEEGEPPELWITGFAARGALLIHYFSDGTLRIHGR